MQLLVLFSAWAPDDTENSRRWVDWYRFVLSNVYRHDDKIVAFNHGTHPAAIQLWSDVPRVVKTVFVPPEMHVDSDASGFQAALADAKPRLQAYDAVMFIHAKGISYNFSNFDGLRPYMLDTILNRENVVSRLQALPDALVCFRGHMTSYRNSIRTCEEFARSIGIKSTPFNFGATLTLYAIRSNRLRNLIDLLPFDYLSKNLEALGHNRFFFEGVVPSLLVMMGAMPSFMEEPRIDPELNDSVSYNDRPAHNSAIVMAEARRRCEQKSSYVANPVPYIFGGIDAEPAQIVFAL